MGSPISAITQIGDLAWAMYKNGIYETAGAFTRSLFNKSAVTKRDIGIDRISEEFTDGTKSGNAVRKVFDLIGLSSMDSLGKETLINSSYERLQKLAQNPNKEFNDRIQRVFGEESKDVIQDLKDGIVSENVKILLFSELADFQPISLSEMPEAYITGGNGRVFYMLKSFTLKQIDIFRREAFDKINKGEVKEGLSNLLKLSAAFVVMNATADEIKALILGRNLSLSDLVVDNMLKLIGFSKFQIYKARAEGIGSATVRTILPPFKFIDALYKDVVNQREIKRWDSISSIPVGGKLYYWWFGRGKEISEKKGKKTGNLFGTSSKGLFKSSNKNLFK
jgi:hypothetical protein